VQAQAARAAQLQAEAAGATPSKTASNGDGDVEMKEAKIEPTGNSVNNGSQNGSVPPSSATMPPAAPRVPSDMVDEIINMLKTAFPLLALMMEKMVDHISIRAKPNSEEDIYRFFAALLNDAMLVSCPREYWMKADESFSNGVAPGRTSPSLQTTSVEI
jgi:transformation/transcription domain-associated protein